jgi:hypothetical protein
MMGRGRADRKAEAERLLRRINGTGVECAGCGVGIQGKVETARVPDVLHGAALEMHRAHEADLASKSRRLPWPNAAMPACQPCRDADVFHLDTLALAAHILGVAPTRGLQLAVEGDPGNPYDAQRPPIAPTFDGPLLTCRRRHYQPGGRSQSIERWATVRPALRAALDQVVAAERITHVRYASGCSLCRTALVPKAQRFVEHGGSVFCPTCADLAVYWDRSDLYSLADLGVAEAAGIRLERGLAAKHGIEPRTAPAGSKPWHWVSLDLVTAHAQAQQLKALRDSSAPSAVKR